MKVAELLKRLKFNLQWVPFTSNFFIVGAAFLVSWLIFNRYSDFSSAKKEINSYDPLVLIMAKVTLVFIALLLLLSILSAVVAWLLYIRTSKKKNLNLELNFEHGKNRDTMWLSSVLKAARRPVLGFIKASLYYNDKETTDKFVLASNKVNKDNFWREGVSGKSALQLPDIREYDVAGSFIFFEDMLQLVSLPIRQKLKGHFYQPPLNLQTKEQEILPLKTEDMDTRIEQLRRIDGEYINYKDFESGDDVRRIVWKVYAKNRELVVRIPEIFNPYASEVYFYASFYTDLNAIESANAYSDAMLNYYKNYVWTVFEALAHKEFEINFVPDNQIKIPKQENYAAWVQRNIANSNWQQSLTLSNYFKPRYGSVLVISSLNTPEEVAEVMEQCSKDTLVYYAKLSDCFKSATPLSLLWRIILHPPQDKYKRIRGTWFFSPFRFRLQKREQKIEKILQQSDVRIADL